MKGQKRICFSFLSLDCLGVEQILNERVIQGWILPELQDCRVFSIGLERAHCPDLKYFVTCHEMGQDENQILESVNKMRGLGWEPVATVNQFDLYRSMPCREVTAPIRRWPRRLFLRSLVNLLLLTGLSLFMVLFALAQGVPILKDWYLSNTGIFLHWFGPLDLVASLYVLIWLFWRYRFRESERPAGKLLLYLRGAFPVLAAAWLLGLASSIVTDLVTSAVYTLFLLGILIGAALFLYIRLHLTAPEKLHPSLATLLAVGLLLSMGLHQVFPAESRAELGTCSWRNTLTSVVRGEELGMDETAVEAASYEKKGSFLVEQTVYWEERKTVSLNSTLYRCRTALLQNTVQDGLLQTAEWKSEESGYDACWSAIRGNREQVLIREGSRLLLLSSEQPLLSLVEEHSLKIP